MSAFKRAEKVFKGCSCVQEAIDAGALDLASLADQDERLVLRTVTRMWARDTTEFSFAEYSGVHVLAGVLDRKQQVELAYSALHECLAPPNCTNLHAHWDASKRCELDSIWPRDGPVLDALYESLPAAAGGRLVLPRSVTLSRVRWATLGYQYNWTERSYSRGNYVAFPARLADVARQLAQGCQSRFDMQAQAGIVNFYPEGQVMGGHQDDGEEALDGPVVSISVGSPCVFLLGGLGKDEEPLPILLRSGDVLLLGGGSRLRYHGVPRVWVHADGPPACLAPDTAGQTRIHTSACACFLTPEVQNRPDPPQVGVFSCSCGGVEVAEVRRALLYLLQARINVNLRQVFR